MREGEAQQRQCHRRHFRSGAAGAQIEQRAAEQKQEHGEQHLRRPRDRRAQYRRMQDDQENHQRATYRRQPHAAK
jgi:hypothetical protein